MDLKKKWNDTLTKRYGWSGREVIDESVKVLESIYDDYMNSGLADPHFDEQLHSDNRCTYFQRLGEMLMFDRLRQQGFSLSSQSKGPDFRAVKNEQVIWLELVTPGVGQDGMIEEVERNYDPLNPNAEESERYRQLLLPRVTGAIDEKQKRFACYLSSHVIPSSDPCVIVVNDALLCPDTEFYGVYHRAENGISHCPLVVEALLGADKPYFLGSAGSTSFKRVDTKREVAMKLKPDSDKKPIPVTGFLGESLSHIGAAMQVTLREDYAYAFVLKNRTQDSNIELGFVQDLLVCNAYAKIALPSGLLAADLWSDNETNQVGGIFEIGNATP